MIGEIFYTDEFGEWFAGLSADDQDAVAHLVELLGQKWLALGHPYSSEIKGSRHALRELRSQKRKPIRVLYAFSPERNAVLLIGGDKAGNPRFYDEIVPRAETIWERYLRERKVSEVRPVLHSGSVGTGSFSAPEGLRDEKLDTRRRKPPTPAMIRLPTLFFLERTPGEASPSSTIPSPFGSTGCCVFLTSTLSEAASRRS